MSGTLWGHIQYRARTRPHNIAIIHSRGTTTYETLERDVDGLTTQLLDQGFADETMVGLNLTTSYLHLLLILSLDRLGIPSFSFVPGATAASYPDLVRKFGLSTVITPQAAPDEPPCRWLQMIDDDAPSIGKADPERLRRLDGIDDAMVRIIWSSGTTGSPKGIPLTRSIALTRFMAYLWFHDLNEASRYLCVVSLAAGYAYVPLMSVLVAGGTVVFAPPTPADFFSLAETVGVTSFTVVPSLLETLIGLARDRGLRFDSVRRIEWAGARLPAKIAQDAQQFLTHNLHSAYGSSEAGMLAQTNASLCIADPQAVGYLFPWMEAEIVDDSDRPLALGAEGLLRIRGNSMVTGYYRDPETSARSFRNGWFYPGDLASIGPRGVLRIVGRADDIIHFDGNKIAPAVIEDYFRQVIGVRDVAAFGIVNARGLQEIAVALVLVDGADLKKIGADAPGVLGKRAPSKLIQVNQLPRSDTGKVLIRELVALAGRS